MEMTNTLSNQFNLYEISLILLSLKNTKDYKIDLSKGKKTNKDLKFQIIERNNQKAQNCKFERKNIETKLSKENLREFLQSKPRPNWHQRIDMFLKYDPELLENWPTLVFLKNLKNNDKKPEKIVMQKTLFEIFVELTYNITLDLNKKQYIKAFRNSQRGLVKYMETIGYRNHSNYTRKQLVFLKNDISD
ncbi:hypothetical protein M0813_15133 [Anaeramoeba flamelloides]|uniref:Homing endonuclease LAGLIDADG domain-containing protein n=1 Tax=Anaeramoeba flamelloides TaxID=1746091 RepID=A0ABQ8Z3B4_9EUKA|nr:hypothetical protein M0813_15133 [Anaeramoeba flamelloides]